MMAASVVAFGYRVPLIVIVVAVALVIGLLLAVSFYVTIGWSVYRSVVDNRRDLVREDLRGELLDRLFTEESDWSGWADGLTKTERHVLESLLDEFLRELDGHDKEKLQGLGVVLGIPERARRQLDSRSELEHLDALTWLTLLQHPEPYLNSGFEPDSPRERAATVTLLIETDRFDHPREGVSMLLDDVRGHFTVFGQDTLYRMSRDDPTPLLEKAASDYSQWEEPLLAQVLAVCAYLDTSVGEQDLTWLTATLETENEAIRAASARALGSFGWRESLRDQVFLERATADPSPRVRAAVYEMLGTWGDRSALSVLLYALVSEEHPRALERGTAALVNRRDRIDPETPAVLGTAWNWSAEHARYDDLARRGTERVYS
ncbi:MAG: HEAT repeat domain-containing protein [Halapricum sp.]